MQKTTYIYTYNALKGDQGRIYTYICAPCFSGKELKEKLRQVEIQLDTQGPIIWPGFGSFFPASLSLFFLVLFLYIIICIEVSFGGCNPYPHHSKFHFALLFIPQFFFQPGPRCSKAAMDHKKLTRTGSWEHVVGYIPGIKINTWSDWHWSLKMV